MISEFQILNSKFHLADQESSVDWRLESIGKYFAVLFVGKLSLCAGTMAHDRYVLLTKLNNSDDIFFSVAISFTSYIVVVRSIHKNQQKFRNYCQKNKNHSGKQSKRKAANDLKENRMYILLTLFYNTNNCFYSHCYTRYNFCNT